MPRELQVGVKILLRNKEGKYLLLQRSPEKYPEAPAQWDIVGGRIEAGTPLLENLKREVQEETNLKLKGEPKLVAAQDILRVPGRHIIRLTFVGEGEGRPVLDDEHTAFRWVTAEELKEVEHLDGYVKELIEKKMILK